MPTPKHAIVQGHNKQTCWFVLHTILLILNVKQENCEYQLFKYLGLTQ